MAKHYDRTFWVDEQTPINAEHMNNIEVGIVTAIEGANEAAVRMEISQDDQTGIVTISLFDAEDRMICQRTLDLETEKIIESVDLDYEHAQLIFTLHDQTTIICDISDLKQVIIDIQNEIGTKSDTYEDETVYGYIAKERKRASDKETDIENAIGEYGDASTEPTVYGHLKAEEERAIQAETDLNDRIDGLDLNEVGANGKYIKFVSQENGQVDAKEQAFDTNFNTATNNNAPTTQAVKTYIDDAINDLDSSVGDDTTVLTGVEIANGKISNHTDRTITSTIEGDSSNIPTDEAVKDYADDLVEATINSLNADSVGEDGKYLKTIIEENGIITATAQPFKTSIGNNEDNSNAPTTKAVKDHVRAEIEKLDVPSAGASGSYLKTISETDGVINATPQAFDTDFTNPTNNNAPTTKAVKDLVDSLDVAEVGANGKYIQKIKEVDGKISTTLQTFETSIGENPTDDNAPTTKAVRDLIKSLDVESVGQDGNYIKTISETDGKISATKEAFSTTIPDSNPSGTLAPTVSAVKTYVDKEINKLDLADVGNVGQPVYVKVVGQADGQLSASAGQFDVTISETPSQTTAPTTKAIKDYADNKDTEIKTAIGTKNDSSSTDTVYGHINKEVEDRTNAIGTPQDAISANTVYGYINNAVNDRKLEAGHSLAVSQDNTNNLVISLLNNSGTVLDTHTVDLKINGIIKTATLEYANKRIVFTKLDNTTFNCDLTTLIDTLQNQITANTDDLTNLKTGIAVSNGDVQIKHNATIEGDLIVRGTTTTSDQETIQSKANIVVTNSENTPLVNYTGTVALKGTYEKYDVNATNYEADKFYYINIPDPSHPDLYEYKLDDSVSYTQGRDYFVPRGEASALYDKTNDSLVLGEGLYIKGEFFFTDYYKEKILTSETYEPNTYYILNNRRYYELATGAFDSTKTYYEKITQNHGETIATRDLPVNLTNDHLMKWDASKFMLVDSGKTISDIEGAISAEEEARIQADADLKDEIEDEIEPLLEAVNQNLTDHIADKTNPHEVTKSQVGLSDVVNKPMDNVPTENSDNYVKSGGAYSSIHTVDVKVDAEITNRTELIKRESNENVLTSDFTEEYILAPTYIPGKTYYRFVSTVDDSYLTGTWYYKSSTIPTSLGTKSFTTPIIAEAKSDPAVDGLCYITSVANNSASIVNLFSYYYTNSSGTRQTQVSPMYWDRWNNWEILSYDFEDSTMLAFMKSFYTKRTNRVLSPEHNTLAELEDMDRHADPEYVEVAIDESTFVPNTFYVKTDLKVSYIYSQLDENSVHRRNTSNPHNVTKAQVGLGNLTNDRQVKGLSTGTTEDHILVFGADGYTVKDSGKTLNDTGKVDTVSITGVNIPADSYKNIDLPTVRVDVNNQSLSSSQKENAKTNLDLNNVDNTSDATKNSATATLENKTIDCGTF